jgi:UDP-3-O-acyl-N-acetylglucosamine deacetylase
MNASLSGLALHSGIPSTLTVARRPEDGRGLRFCWPGFAAPLEAGDWIALRRGARRATVLENGAGGVIRTPEHLLAAALFFADAPLDLHCDAAEPPGLDGSALPFYKALSAFAPPARAKEYDSNADWEHDGPEGSMRARAHSHFSVEYFWDAGDVHQHFHLSAAADAPGEILPARTFIAWRDWKALAGDRNFLAGADADSGLLIAATASEFAEARGDLPESSGKAFPLLHPESFRMGDELARHKVLDLLGDLALNGLALPRLRLTVRNGGHALNHMLLDRLQGEFGGPDERSKP